MTLTREGDVENSYGAGKAKVSCPFYGYFIGGKRCHQFWNTVSCSIIHVFR